MEKIKEKSKKLNSWKFIILVVLVVGASFYWYEIRPSKIYSLCATRAKDSVLGSDLTISEGIKSYDFIYKICLRNNGLK